MTAKSNTPTFNEKKFDQINNEKKKQKERFVDQEQIVDIENIEELDIASDDYHTSDFLAATQEIKSDVLSVTTSTQTTSLTGILTAPATLTIGGVGLLAAAAGGGSGSSSSENNANRGDNESDRPASQQRTISDADVAGANANEPVVINLVGTNTNDLVFTNQNAPANGFVIQSDKSLKINAEQGSGAITVETDESVTALLGEGEEAITTGAGDDTIILAKDSAGKGDRIDTGAGEDTIVISGDIRNIIGGENGAELIGVEKIDLNSSLSIVSALLAKAFDIVGDGESRVQIQIDEQVDGTQINLADLAFDKLGTLTIESDTDIEVELSEETLAQFTDLDFKTLTPSDDQLDETDSGSDAAPASPEFSLKSDAATAIKLLENGQLAEGAVPTITVEDTAEALEGLKTNDEFNQEAQKLGLSIKQTLVVAFNNIDEDAPEGLQITIDQLIENLTVADDASLAITAIETTNSDIVTTQAADDQQSFSVGLIENANGGVEISVQLTNSTDNSTIDALVVFAVNSINDAPTGSDSTVTLEEDQTFTLSEADFGFADAIDNDQLAAVVITNLPEKGTLSLTNSNGQEEVVAVNQTISAEVIRSGQLTFTPASNDNGDAYATVSFKVQDNGLAEGENTSAVANTLTFNVTAVNDVPTTQSNTVTTDEDTSVQFSIADFAFTDVDADDALKAVEIQAAPNKGTLRLDGTAIDFSAGTVKVAVEQINQLTYAPAANDNGDAYATIAFKVIDSADSTSEVAEIIVNVLPINDAPETADRTLAVDQFSGFQFSANDFQFSDVDQDDVLTQIDILSAPDQGQLLLNGSQLVFTENKASIAIDDIANLTFEADQGAAPSADGEIYSSFDFAVVDAAGTASTLKTVSIQIVEGNVAPQAEDDVFTINEDTVSVFDVLRNDTDANGDDLAITAANAQSGVVEVIGNQIRYTPAADFSGTDSITYTITDAEGETSTATARVTITPVNDRPEIQGDLTINLDSTNFQNLTTADINFFDVDSEASDIIYRVSNLPADVVLSVNGESVDANGESITRFSHSDLEQGGVDIIYQSDNFANNLGFDIVATDGQDLSSTEFVQIFSDINNSDFDDGAPSPASVVSANEQSFTIEVKADASDTVTLQSPSDPTMTFRFNQEKGVYEGTATVDSVNSSELFTGDLIVKINDGPFGVDRGHTLVLGSDRGEEIKADNANLQDEDFDNGRFTSYGFKGNDVIQGGDRDDFLFGGAGDDFVTGEGGDDLVVGGAGDDQLLGGAGDDIVTGGSGNDTFVITDDNEFDSNDRITDFRANGDNDKIGIFYNKESTNAPEPAELSRTEFATVNGASSQSQSLTAIINRIDNKDITLEDESNDFFSNFTSDGSDDVIYALLQGVPSNGNNELLNVTAIVRLQDKNEDGRFFNPDSDNDDDSKSEIDVVAVLSNTDLETLSASDFNFSAIAD